MCVTIRMSVSDRRKICNETEVEAKLLVGLPSDF